MRPFRWFAGRVLHPLSVWRGLMASRLRAGGAGSGKCLGWKIKKRRDISWINEKLRDFSGMLAAVVLRLHEIL